MLQAASLDRQTGRMMDSRQGFPLFGRSRVGFAEIAYQLLEGGAGLKLFGDAVQPRRQTREVLRRAIQIVVEDDAGSEEIVLAKPSTVGHTVRDMGVIRSGHRALPLQRAMSILRGTLRREGWLK